MQKDEVLNQTVTALEGLLSRLIREDITLACHLAPEPAMIRIDPTQLEQAILNLVLNAGEGLPPRGELRLEVAHVRRSQLDVPPEQTPAADQYVRLCVRDTGIGISTAVRAHLFEPFFTTKEVGKGTGLGLASVYGIVRQSNGFITVESEQGVGSVFAMHFPAVRDAGEVAAGAPASATTAVGASGQETLLLVEDEAAVRAVVTAVLRRHGYRVLEASRPRPAIEVFAER